MNFLGTFHGVGGPIRGSPFVVTSVDPVEGKVRLYIMSKNMQIRLGTSATGLCTRAHSFSHGAAGAVCLFR